LAGLLGRAFGKALRKASVDGLPGGPDILRVALDEPLSG
jgi:hypothetical protein